MAVEDRTAKGERGSVLASRAERHVSPGQHELEGTTVGVAEHADTLVPSPPAGVVLELSVVALVPARFDQALEDRSNQRALIAGEEIGVELRPGDVPVRRDASAKQPAVTVHVVPGKGDLGS